MEFRIEDAESSVVSSVRRLLVTASIVASSPILVTLLKEALIFSETRFLPPLKPQALHIQ
jgi:hypothetical protein